MPVHCSNLVPPPLQLNTYMARPGAAQCQFCPKGTETQDTGNAECTPCVAGYFNKAQATQSDTPACEAAPEGTYVNTTGAYYTTPW